MEHVIEKLKNIETPTTKKPFSLLEMLYRQVHGKELVQSEMLAGLLRPTENHGHGFDLIESFLWFIDVDFELQKDSNLKVETERKVEGRRSIDILISWLDGNKKHAVIIENKLNNAPNQPNQLNDYHDSLIKEGYEVDKIVYMPFSKKWQKSENTDTRKDVLAKTIDRDAQGIADWLGTFIGEGGFHNEDCTVYTYQINAIWQYYEFLNCLISSQYLMQQVIEIQDKLSTEEIVKLEKIVKIVNSKEWSEARVKPITDEMKKDFPNMIIQGKSNLMDDSECNNYVQLWFEDYKFWVELWIYPKNIKLYLCSDKEETNVTIANIEFTGCYDYDYKRYYYHSENDKLFDFDIADTNGIIKALKPILQELSK
jgi:hypothetical protein